MKRLLVILFLAGLILQVQGAATALAADGSALYSASCAACHGALDASNIKTTTAAKIKAAIKNNTGGMGSLSTLKSSDISAIAATLKKALPSITAFRVTATADSLIVTIKTFTAKNAAGYLVNESSTAPSASDSAWSTTAPASYTFSSIGKKKLYAWVKDAAGNVSKSKLASLTLKASAGAALYDANCKSCHGALASSTAKGATATDIQNAIKNVGLMSGLQSLTSAKITSIAKALAATQAPHFDAGMPVEAGPAASGDAVSIRVNTGLFSGPVDISLVLYTPSADAGNSAVNVYAVRSDNTLAVPNGKDIFWRSCVTGVDEEIEINVPGLPAGAYIVGLSVTPAGDRKNYSHWTTGFTVE